MADPPASPETIQPSAGAEADLVARLKAGDDHAYEHLVRELGGRLLVVARRITGTDADAEDAVQEAFVSAFRSIDDFDGRATLSTWLHRIVVNAALMRLRQRKRDHTVSIESLLPTFEAGLHREHPRPWTPPAALDGSPSRESAAIREAIDQLPDEFRTVLVLRDIAGLDSKSVAASLGISDGLVRQRLHRGRMALMKLLEPMMTEQHP